MSDYNDGLERGGDCNDCGEPVEQEHHAYCASCFREQMGWTAPARPKPGEEPRSYIVGLNDLRERVDQLEKEVVLLNRVAVRRAP
jgi:hypothetical protein